MLGSGCGIELDQCDDSILGRRRGIFCSPANTAGNRFRTLAVLAPVSSRAVALSSRHLLARTNVPPTNLRESVAERGHAPHLPEVGHSSPRMLACAAIPPLRRSTTPPTHSWVIPECSVWGDLPASIGSGAGACPGERRWGRAPTTHLLRDGMRIWHGDGLRALATAMRGHMESTHAEFMSRHERGSAPQGDERNGQRVPVSSTPEQREELAWLRCRQWRANCANRLRCPAGVERARVSP